MTANFKTNDFITLKLRHLIGSGALHLHAEFDSDVFIQYLVKYFTVKTHKDRIEWKMYIYSFKPYFDILYSCTYFRNIEHNLRDTLYTCTNTKPQYLVSTQKIRGPLLNM